MGVNYRSNHVSKEDLTQNIPKSVFVTNFPDHFTLRDLWNVCVAYGNVVDVFIPYKKSKAGKRFAFVRYIKVVNLERLIENLYTIWIGRLHLHANAVRFQKEPLKSPFQKRYVEKLKNFKVIPNIHAMLENEGFTNVNVSYMGGLWVLLKSDVSGTKEKLFKHKGVYLLRLCLITPILRLSHLGDSVKIIIKGKVYWIRVNEVDSWSPTFKFSENYLSSDKDEDPFGIYKILNRNHAKKSLTNDDPKFPPGFTLEIENEQGIGEEAAQEHAMERTSQPTWLPTSSKLLIISVYAPQDPVEKRMLWEYLLHLIQGWDGEYVLMGDFNEVRSEHERFGTVFNTKGAKAFNTFIAQANLIDLPLEGYSFTWSHKSASKMSKLDRFLVSEGYHVVSRAKVWFRVFGGGFTILLGLSEDIYAAVDSCETAQEIWLREIWRRVQQMMKGSDIEIQEKKAKNKHFPEKIASNLKFLNNLQPEWSRYVTIVHQTKDLHTADYTQLYDFLKYNQKEVDELKAEQIAKIQDSLALMANSNNLYASPAPHQDQSPFNHNFLQQPITNPEDITDPTTTMNMALALMAKAFKLNYSTPTNNNKRISSNPRNRQIA
nr:RNA-directed DNA polymerase, eukaryota [Tanacetum cinerariifolium]